jgi:hypothetical protein
LFTNRRRTRAKVLLWDGTGLCIHQKRIERGRFAKLCGAEPRAYLRKATLRAVRNPGTATLARDLKSTEC